MVEERELICAASITTGDDPPCPVNRGFHRCVIPRGEHLMVLGVELHQCDCNAPFETARGLVDHQLIRRQLAAQRDQVNHWSDHPGPHPASCDALRLLPPAAGRPQPRASDHHVEMLCAVAAHMPVRLIHLTDPERVLAGWKANMRQYADAIAAEAFHAGAAYGLSLQSQDARYIVVTEQEYERIRDADRLPPSLIERCVPAAEVDNEVTRRVAGQLGGTVADNDYAEGS